MASASSTKPLTMVGMPRSASTASSGSVPPRRISTGGTPQARSSASAASLSAGSCGSNSDGSASSHSISTCASRGAAARSRPSMTSAISSARWPGASRWLTKPRASAGTMVRGSPPASRFTSTAGSAPTRS